MHKILAEFFFSSLEEPGHVQPGGEDDDVIKKMLEFLE